jgi:MFS transporter, MHS family, shikimate and dehydroshikimate transport protein
MYGPQASFMAELFSTRVRYSGASLGYQLASIFAGGASPLIATYLLTRSGGNPTPIAWYMIVLAAITVVSVYLAAESYKTGGEK